MSKPALKKHFLSFTREQLVETILDMYDNMKPVKEYFEYFLNPNEKEMLADLILTLPEVAYEFTYNYGDMTEQFYNSAYNNFKVALGRGNTKI